MNKTYYFYSEVNDLYLLTQAENKIEAKSKFTNRLNNTHIFEKEKIPKSSIIQLQKFEVVELT